MTFTKQQQQVIILGAVLVIIGAALIYMNLDKFMPVPSGATGEFVLPARPALPATIDLSALKRDDFPSAQAEIPEPNASTDGVEDIFGPLP
jgi:hypothetical protein